jgi:hypothetical protein
MTLIMPTRELVGLLADVHPFASKDDEDTIWHKVVIRWDGTRLHAMAGDGHRMAHMSWGPDDGDQPAIPGLDPYRVADEPWELAILPENAKEIATKFKLSAVLGDAPVRVDGSTDVLRVDRDADICGVALTSTALSRPWDENAPVIDEAIAGFAEAARTSAPRDSVAYSGFALADFCNPKVVRQRGPVELKFGRAVTFIEIGQWFRGAVQQASTDN